MAEFHCKTPQELIDEYLGDSFHEACKQREAKLVAALLDLYHAVIEADHPPTPAEADALLKHESLLRDVGEK